MRYIQIGVGIVLVLVGVVWILQGIGTNLFPSSFMIGDIKWAIIGAIAAVVGVLFLRAGLVARRAGSSE